MDKQITVLYYYLSFETTKELLQKLLIEDYYLDEVTKQYAEEVKEKGIEVWNLNHNIITTEQGYLVGISNEILETLKIQKQMLCN